MCYFDNATLRTKITVNTICHELKNPKLGKIDLVVGIGFSGTLLLTAIHIQSGIPFGAIRKDTGGTHSNRSMEIGGIDHLRDTKRYVIIDDFTTSGKTIDCIKTAMSGHECVGIIFYQQKRACRENFPNIPLICLEYDIEEIAGMRCAEKETCGV